MAKLFRKYTPPFAPACGMYVSANDYAWEALRLMRSYRLPSVPVLERDEWIGCVFAEDMNRVSNHRLKEQDVKAYLRTGV